MPAAHPIWVGRVVGVVLRSTLVRLAHPRGRGRNTRRRTDAGGSCHAERTTRFPRPESGVVRRALGPWSAGHEAAAQDPGATPDPRVASAGRVFDARETPHAPRRLARDRASGKHFVQADEKSGSWGGGHHCAWDGAPACAGDAASRRAAARGGRPSLNPRCQDGLDSLVRGGVASFRAPGCTIRENVRTKGKCLR